MNTAISEIHTQSWLDPFPPLKMKSFQLIDISQIKDGFNETNLRAS